LARAGLAEPVREGRTVSYSVRYAQLTSTLRSLADAIEECAPTARPGREACRGRC
jgi:hypothetical protein